MNGFIYPDFKYIDKLFITRTIFRTWREISMPTLKQTLSYLLLGQKGGQNRIQVIEALNERPYNINKLADHLNLNYRTVKYHMEILLKHELVIASKSGGSVDVYFLSPKMEDNMELFGDITRKLKDSTFSNRFLQNVLEQTNDAVIMVGNNDEIVFWNSGSERIFGYNEMEVLGEKLHIFKDSSFFSDRIKEIEKGDKVIGVETKGTNKTGNTLDLSITVDRIKENDEEIIGHSVLARDITERKKAQEQIIKAKERLEHVLSSSAAVIFTERTSEDYGATFISENIAQLVGYHSSEFIKNPGFWLEHVHPDDKKRVLQEIPQIIEKGHHSYEYRFQCKNGQYIWLRDEMKCIRDENGNPVEIVGFCSDITKYKEM
jgi:PAS domain S-box-containing protein